TRLTLRGLPVTLRLLFSCFMITIGIGYLFALSYLFLLDIQPHKEKGIGLIQGTIIKYYGARSETRMEAALEGSMAAMMPSQGREALIQWVRKGGPEEGYENIRPLLEEFCVSCHSPESGLPVPPLGTYDEVRELTEMDFGPSLRTLARVSHVHMFGLSFIFLLTGVIFSLSEVNKKFRLVIVALPFVAIWLDVGSWWFTKFQPLFAYTVIFGGALMGLALGAQIIISIRDMWFLKKQED
ncbi:MAG TPA: hypothetical protein VLB09_02895, partial [Nitrospiria bacterium]|nr:hypothetical protein [Nitrospiria bacterium]